MQVVASIEHDLGHQIGVGQGRNSEVYLSNDPQLGGTLVVKRIEKARFADSAKFWSESQAMHAAEHDHVVQIRYACQTSTHVCLAMPYYAKGSLTDRIKDGPLLPLEVIRVGQGILNGLASIHNAGYVHFDIKPSNVLFSDSDMPMLADFGQSGIIGSDGLSPAPVLMYNVCMPPELFTYGHGSPASDIFQVGLTLYRAANGDSLFNEQVPGDPSRLRKMILDGDFPDRENFMPHVPKAIRSALRVAMRVDSSSRYGTATEFAKALGRITVTMNWSMNTLSNGDIEWSARRDAKAPAMVVGLRSTGKKYDVTLHTERQYVRRRTQKPSWIKAVTHHQAIAHLKKLFEQLE